MNSESQKPSQSDVFKKVLQDRDVASPAPTQTDIDSAENQPKNKTKSLLVRGGLTLGALGGLFGLGEAAYQLDLLPVKPIHQTVDNSAGFDPMSLNINLKATDIGKMTPEEYAEVAPPMYKLSSPLKYLQ